MKKSSRNGSPKVLLAFLAGLVIACIIIGSLLWYMNHHQTTFQEPEPARAKPTKPEPITIVDQTPPVVINSIPVTPESNSNLDQAVSSAPVVPSQPTTPTNTVNQASVGIPPVPITNNIPQGQNYVEDNPPTVAQPENNHNKNNSTNNKYDPVANILKKLESNEAVAPTPQTAKQLSARDILNGRTSNTSSIVNTDKVVMQFGSFSQLDQAQRRVADLAKLSVRGSTVKVVVGGKIWYRVVSGTMNRDTATKLKDKLHQNQIDSLIISQH